ncbi:MAG: LptF/LptG family permease [Ginsengibacter sp.]
MKKLDWYILNKFLKTFFFALLLLNIVLIIIDLSEKADDFVRTKLPVSRLITDYYFGFLPRINAMLFPLFVFISVIAFTSAMANRSEVIAILSSGTTFNRFLRPFVIGGLLLSGMLWWANQKMIPRANEKYAYFDNKYINFNAGSNNYTSLNNYYFRIDSNTYAGIRYYDTSSHRGNNFFVQRFKNNLLEYNLRAESIQWDTATRKWKLENIMEENVNPMSQKIIHEASMYVSYNFKPRDLQRDEYMKDKMPTSDLNEFIQLEKLRGSEIVNTLLVEKYNRDAIPASVLVLTIIGAVLASRKRKGGSGYHLLMGVIICITYILVSRFAIVFAIKANFNAFLAAWIPNVLFGGIALYLYRISPK